MVDSSTDNNLRVVRRLPRMPSALQTNVSDKGIDGAAWDDTYQMIASMIISEAEDMDVDVRMIQEYFEIEASTATPQ